MPPRMTPRTLTKEERTTTGGAAEAHTLLSKKTRPPTPQLATDPRTNHCLPTRPIRTGPQSTQNRKSLDLPARRFADRPSLA
jgi:hypothetical protein